jgi:hypothetical protein
MGMHPNSSSDGSPPSLDHIRRISIVGATGSGKTVLAAELADKMNLPLYSLDSIRCNCLADGGERNDFAASVASLVVADQWIIDGHYRDVRDAIWRRSEAVVWLNYPLFVVGTRLLGRFLQKRRRRPGEKAAHAGPIREAPAPVEAGWSERLARYGRTLKERGEYRRLLSAPHLANVSIIELKSPQAARRWLAEIA